MQTGRFGTLMGFAVGAVGTGVSMIYPNDKTLGYLLISIGVVTVAVSVPRWIYANRSTIRAAWAKVESPLIAIGLVVIVIGVLITGYGVYKRPSAASNGGDTASITGTVGPPSENDAIITELRTEVEALRGQLAAATPAPPALPTRVASDYNYTREEAEEIIRALGSLSKVYDTASNIVGETIGYLRSLSNPPPSMPEHIGNPGNPRRTEDRIDWINKQLDGREKRLESLQDSFFCTSESCAGRQTETGGVPF